MPTNINFVEKLDAGCDTQVSFNLPKTLSLGTVKKSLDNNGLSEAEGCSYLALNRLNETALLNKASLVINPSSFSENAVYADVPANSTLGDLVFTRATDAWRTNSQGLIQRVAWNLFQQSQTFNNAAWSKSRTSVLPNTAISPNGDLTATTLIEDTNNASHRVFQTISKSSTPIQYTFSCYLKAKERTFAQIRIAENGELDSASAVINLSTGQLIGTYGAYSNRTASVVSLNNGWYRLSITVTSVNASSIVAFIFLALNGNLATPSYLGDGTSGIYIWGAQLVEGASPLEYFTTTDRQDVPRIDYSLGGCPNILLEPQRTNLALYSQEFDNASWTKVDATITANTTISPSGVQDADTVSITGSTSRVIAPNTLSAGTYTVSIWVKILSGSGTTRFNLTLDGVNTSSVFSPTNEWQRFTYTFTAVTSATLIAFRAQTFVGNVAIWGAQIETGAYATSYIPTTSASVTRNADVMMRSNVFTNNLITASGGTWFLDLKNTIPYVRINANFLFLSTINNGFGGDGFLIYNNAITIKRPTLGKFVSGVFSDLTTLSSNNSKLAIKWNGTTADIFENGVKVVSATSFTGTAMQFMSNQSLPIPFYINSIMLFPTPLSDAECIQLTT
jgi:hypothetical protein